MVERDIARALAEREGGQCEVRTPAGNIDVLTPKYLYEVKVARLWKAALGQVLAYAVAYPDHKPRLYLYGETGGVTKKTIEEHCRAAGVGVVWHRDDDAPPAPRPEPAPPADAMTLQLAALDATYRIRSTCTFRLRTPTALVQQAEVEAYADQALAVFNALLDNALTINVAASFNGETVRAERARDGIVGDPVCYQLKLTLRTTRPLHTFTASLPGARKRLFAIGAPKQILEINHARRPLPELQRLAALITHPLFPWASAWGETATGIEVAHWRNYGIVQGKRGPRIGR